MPRYPRSDPSSRGSGLVTRVPAAGALLAVAIIAAAAASCGGSPEPGSEPGIKGLWEVATVRNLTKGEDQPYRREYHQFGDTYQMVIVAGENRPKLTKSVSDMTPEEFQSQQPIGAGLYRFEWDGKNVVRTNVAALSAYYEGRSFPGELELSGDTLVLRDSHSADGDMREWTMRRVK